MIKCIIVTFDPFDFVDIIKKSERNFATKTATFFMINMLCAISISEYIFHNIVRNYITERVYSL